MIKAKKYIYLYTGIFQMLLAFFAFFNSNLCLQYLNLILFWLIFVYFAYKGRQNTVPLLFFLLTFFLFLLGKDFFEVLFGYGDFIYSLFPHRIYSHIYYCLHLSLFAIFLGAFMFQKNIIVVSDFCSSIKIILLRKIAKKIIYITLIFKVITIVIGAYNMIKYSYVDLEANKMSSLYIIDRLSQLNYLSIVVFLITYPTKKEVLSVLKWILPIYVLSLLGGARGPAMYFLIYIVSYLLFRDYLNKKSKFYSEIFLTKSVKMFMAVSLIPLMIFLTVFASIRSHENYESKGNGAIDLFLQQGGSYGLIGYAEQYKHILPVGNISYTFGPILAYVEPVLNADKRDIDFLTYDALYGNNLGATLTYLDLPAYYYMGGGYGTQYIAELYADFGYWGVFIFSFILGIFFVRISFFSTSSWIKNSLFAACILSFYGMPRDYYLCWINMVFSFWNIAFIFLLNYYLNKQLKKKKYRRLNV